MIKSSPSSFIILRTAAHRRSISVLEIAGHFISAAFASNRVSPFFIIFGLVGLVVRDLTGKHMAHFGGTLRGLPYGPGPAQDAAIVGFNDGMAERSERNAPPPLVDVELNDSNGLAGGGHEVVS